MCSKSYIKEVYVTKMWGRREIHWDVVNPDVNILVGVNGSGKTTLLNMINAYYNGKVKEMNTYDGKIKCFPLRGNVFPLSFVRSFDVPIADKRKVRQSPLLQELLDVVYQNDKGNSFFNYRMKIVDYPEKAKAIQENINELFDVINDIFSDTGKIVHISKGNNSLLVFKQKDDTVQLEQLSSGEKQMLLLLMTVFLQERQPAILLLDEPELSLHISWQQKLIAALRRLNPLCQLILTTHSPSIFAKGWADKITFVEDICQ